MATFLEGRMFERFTDQARRVIVLAQEEARDLRHRHIGTEHVLLALLAIPERTAARVLHDVGLDHARARARLLADVPVGASGSPGHLPFTRAAKAALEGSLREALALGHRAIEPEHILLGLLRAGHDELGLRIVAEVAPPEGVRERLTARWSPPLPDEYDPTGRPGAPAALGTLSPAGPWSPAMRRAASLARERCGDRPVTTCRLLLAILADPEAAATRAVRAQDIDVEALRATLQSQSPIGTSDESSVDTAARSLWFSATGETAQLEVTDTVLVRAIARIAAQLPHDIEQRRRFLDANPDFASGFGELHELLRRLAEAGEATRPPDDHGDADERAAT